MKLEFVDPKTGKRLSFVLKHKMKIGRKKADITIPDSKVSSFHAEITKENGKFYIKDAGSTNKIVYKGAKVDSLELYNGVEFSIGGVDIVSIGSNSSSLSEAESTQGAGESSEDKEVNSSEKAKHWSETIKFALKDLLEIAEQGNEEVYPFSVDLLLTVTKGPQKNRSIPLLYGPRSVGNLKQDVRVLDWNIGEASFQLVEHDNNIYLTTDYPNQVLVNKLPGTTIKLSTGDKIQLGQSELEVEVKSYE